MASFRPRRGLALPAAEPFAAAAGSTDVKKGRQRPAGATAARWPRGARQPIGGGGGGGGGGFFRKGRTSRSFIVARRRPPACRASAQDRVDALATNFEALGRKSAQGTARRKSAQGTASRPGVRIQSRLGSPRGGRAAAMSSPSEVELQQKTDARGRRWPTCAAADQTRRPGRLHTRPGGSHCSHCRPQVKVDDIESIYSLGDARPVRAARAAARRRGGVGVFTCGQLSGLEEMPHPDGARARRGRSWSSRGAQEGAYAIKCGNESLSDEKAWRRRDGDSRRRCRLRPAAPDERALAQIKI